MLNIYPLINIIFSNLKKKEVIGVNLAHSYHYSISKTKIILLILTNPRVFSSQSKKKSRCADNYTIIH